MEQLSLAGLSDERLVAELGERVRRVNEDKAGLLPYLAEVDRRRLYAKLGYSSMFTFCVQRFRMSEATAVKRIRAARAAQRFPILLDMIARAEIHLSGLHRLAAHLTADNHHDVLAEAKHKTLKEIDAIVARLAPQPDVPSTLRALPRPSAAATPDPPDLFASVAATRSSEPAAQPPAAAPAATVSSAEPAARPPAAAAAPPRPARAHDPIPLAPRQYAPSGHRCNETRCLEYAHIEPWAKGGEHTVDNVALRCRAHNTYEAVRDYGELFMQRKIDEARSVREPASTYRAA